MKKLLSLLICLCLALPCAGALAAGDQDALAQAFRQKAQSLLNNVPEDSVLTCTLAPAGDAQPMIVQATQEAAWLSYRGQAFEFRYADAMGIAQALLSASDFSQADPQVVQEILRLLYVDLIIPHVKTSVSQEAGRKTIVISFTAQDVAKGLARFGDQVLSSEKYSAVLLPVIEYFARTQGYEGDLQAELPAQWPQLKENLLSVKTDEKVEIKIVEQTKNNAKVVVFSGIYSENENKVEIKGNYTDQPGGFALHLNAAETIGERNSEWASLSLTGNRKTGHIDGTLTVPPSGEYRLTGHVGGKGMQCQVTGLVSDTLRWMANVNAAAANGVVTSSCTVTVDQNTVAAQLYWSPERKALSVHNVGQQLGLTLDTDGQGRFTAALMGPYQQFDAKLTGVARGNSLTAQLKYLEQNRQVFLADVNAVAQQDQLSLNAAVDAGRQSGAFSLAVAKNDFNASWQSDTEMSALTVQWNERSQVTLARLVTGNGRYSGYEAVYDGSTVQYRDAYRFVSIVPEFESETAHVLNVTETEKLNPPARHTAVRTELKETETTWAIETRVFVEEEETASCCLTCAPAAETAMLRDQEPILVDAAFVQALMSQPAVPEE